ncbi:MAG: Protein OS-9 [Chrysothrix sp. TS-e1954]|nr:MAG: Protein OS-9 [Chrysothrix sp. TS-e1954]
MRAIWGVLAVLGLSSATTQPFSVHNDLLSHPQYELVYSDTYITSQDANIEFQRQRSRSKDEPESLDLSSQHGTEQHVLAGDALEEDDQEQLERMILDDRPFLCRIPYVAPETSDNTTRSDTSEEEQQQELVRASDHGWELLRGMQGTCLYYVAGWWTYSFCFNNGVRQFHAVPARGGMVGSIMEDPAVHAFNLGLMPKSSEKKEDGKDLRPGSSRTDLSSQLQAKGEMKYLVQTLEGGSVCDLTGNERRIEVQFHCNPGAQDQISLIKETASCVYLMIIQTPRLCNDVAFLPPQGGKPSTITCQAILEPHEEDEWKALKTEIAENELFVVSPNGDAPAADSPAPPLIIGGIEVGAQIYVGGSPERTIKGSKIVTPPKQRGEEKFIATLAKSDGKYTTIMSEAEIKKHGLNRRPDEVNELIKNIQLWAGEGRAWKLDMLHTGEGMEFRGVLLDAVDEDTEKSKDEKSETAKEEKGSDKGQNTQDQGGGGS